MKILLVVTAFYLDGSQEPKMMIPMPSYKHCMDVAKYYTEVTKIDPVLRGYATRVDCFNPSTKESEH